MMKVALVLGLAFFCSLWSRGVLFKCSFCSSTVSYEDCQKNLTTENCSEGQVCFQADVKFEKGDKSEIIFQKGCLGKSFCDAYSKGDIGECITRKGQGYTVDCNGKCCSDGNECNKENLLNQPIDQGVPLKCSFCSSTVSYEDCQKNLTTEKCSEGQVCFQADVKFEKGDKSEIIFQKGCLGKSFCDAYSKGDIGECKTREAQGYTVDCSGKCCFDGDECNKENLLNQPIDQGLPLKCSSCSSNVSYEDCQKKLMAVNCTEDQVCFQADAKYEKGDKVIITIQKGCVGKTLCDAYSKGDIEECKTRKAQGYTVLDCNGKCCFDGDECNKENPLPNNQGSAFLISVMVLLLSVLLTLSNVN